MHIRRAHAFQLALHDLFNSKNPVENNIWKALSISLNQPVTKQADAIRNQLGIDIESQVSWHDDEQALKSWRKSIEATGIFVFKALFKQKDISGFCLMDNEFPLIYLNNSASKTRQIFSLLHELVHILLSMNGLSKFDLSYINRLSKEQKKLEIFCNVIAADVLIPPVDFKQQIRNWPENIEGLSDDFFAELASRYGVSREAILRRFLDQSRVSVSHYNKKANYWSSQKKPAKGGDWYSNQGAYLSDRFVKEVVGRHYQHKLSIEQAADYLGIKAKNFSGLEERILRGMSK